MKFYICMGIGIWLAVGLVFLITLTVSIVKNKTMYSNHLFTEYKEAPFFFIMLAIAIILSGFYFPLGILKISISDKMRQRKSDEELKI